MRKDGKLFGKISIIDLLALLAIVVLAIGVFLRFSGNQTVQVSAGEALECVVQVENIREGNVEGLQNGGAVFDKETKEYIGEITEVTVKPGETMLLMADGTHRLVETEGRYTALVTIAFSGKVSDKGYYTDTNRQMGVGGTLQMNTKFSQCKGEILEVRQSKK